MMHCMVSTCCVAIIREIYEGKHFVYIQIKARYTKKLKNNATPGIYCRKGLVKVRKCAT